MRVFYTTKHIIVISQLLKFTALFSLDKKLPTFFGSLQTKISYSVENSMKKSISEEKKMFQISMLYYIILYVNMYYILIYTLILIYLIHFILKAFFKKDIPSYTFF